MSYELGPNRIMRREGVGNEDQTHKDTMKSVVCKRREGDKRGTERNILRLVCWQATPIVI